MNLTHEVTVVISVSNLVGCDSVCHYFMGSSEYGVSSKQISECQYVDTVLNAAMNIICGNLTTYVRGEGGGIN